jgi:hypothetical protein
VVSSAPSSPLYEPRLPGDDPDPPPELIEALERAEHEYETKMGNFLTEKFASPGRFLRVLEI